MAKIKIVVTAANASEDEKNIDHSYIAGGNVRCYSHSGKEYDSFLQTQTCAYHMTQQLHSAFIPKK